MVPRSSHLLHPLSQPGAPILWYCLMGSSKENVPCSNKLYYSTFISSQNDKGLYEMTWEEQIEKSVMGQLLKYKYLEKETFHMYILVYGRLPTMKSGHLCKRLVNQGEERFMNRENYPTPLPSHPLSCLSVVIFSHVSVHKPDWSLHATRNEIEGISVDSVL